MELGHVDCRHHGQQRPTFVCAHLVSGSGLGFVEPYGDQTEGTDTDHDAAWCDSCEAVRANEGGWTDTSEAVAQVTMICGACFETSRQRNAR